MVADAREDTYMIVLEGSLNPAIFQPRWLAEIGVLDRKEAEDAELRMVSSAMTFFRTARFEVQVTSDFGLFRTRTGEDPEALRDLTIRMFCELPHTPISSLTLVHRRHVPGPHGIWQDLAQRLVDKSAVESLMPNSAPTSIELEQHRTQASVAPLQLLLEPTADADDSIYCRTQAVLQPADTDHSAARDAMKLLTEQWTEFLAADEQVSLSVARAMG